MTAQIPASQPPRPASLSGFLHHVERRGAVLAELACGDPARGDAAVAAAMRTLCARLARARDAGDMDPGQLDRFWTLLLAAPPLRNPAPAPGHWPAALAVFGALEPGVRAAVLLRLVAGLDDAQAADVLRVAPTSIRRAIAAASAQPAGSSRAAFWDSVARAVEHHVQQLPPERLVRLAAARERALLGTDVPVRSAPAASPWRRPAMVAAGCAVVLAVASTFLPRRPEADPRIAISALPAADAPASTYDGETGLLTHPDFEQLADTRDADLVQELDFYAWYAAQLAASGAATPLLLPDAGHAAPTPPPGHPDASR